ncbi:GLYCOSYLTRANSFERASE [Salix purpurea]|uniref:GLYCOSYLTRANSFERASE n=1 Tax=Salix purpurea TaxID=77065 RepID=A0A9Q0TVK8_SALPP|nr:GLYCOSYLTRANSFERASE [Salix purpurea]
MSKSLVIRKPRPSLQTSTKLYDPHCHGVFLGIMNYCWAKLETVKGLGVVDFVGLPRSPSFKQEHLPSGICMYQESDPDCRPCKGRLVANKLSHGFIFNSFESLEGDYLGFLKREVGHEGVYAVGPVNLLGPDSTDGVIPVRSSSGNVFEWLDGCPDASVLYVCFGSQKSLSKKQMEALGRWARKEHGPFHLGREKQARPQQSRSSAGEHRRVR